jgi:EpsI family protein
MPPLLSPSQLPVGRILVVIVLGMLTVGAFKLSSSVNTPTKSGVIMKLPSDVGEFTGKEEEPSEGEKYVLPKDTEIVKKSYTDLSGDMLSATVVLAGAEKRSIHRPELCLPAQGWSINREKVVPVTLADGRTISIMQVSISRLVSSSSGASRMLNSYYDYWFVGNGITTPSHITRLLINSWDRVIHHKNHRWAYVAVSAPVLEGFKRDGKNAEETEAMMAGFIAQMAPSVMKKPEQDDTPSSRETGALNN